VQGFLNTEQLVSILLFVCVSNVIKIPKRSDYLIFLLFNYLIQAGVGVGLK
jgi:hypothetical protein